MTRNELEAQKKVLEELRDMVTDGEFMTIDVDAFWDEADKRLAQLSKELYGKGSQTDREGIGQERLSSCCHAPVFVGSSDEGTNWYECGQCLKPCDIWDRQKTAARHGQKGGK